MEAYLIECLGLLLRWLHVIVAIAWIGSSFYFIWLDNHLRPPVDASLRDKGVAGELWAVHGGGFYNPQKYLLAPAQLPAELHWFKWEAYSTWLSGLALMTTVYYLQASTWMVDPVHATLAPPAAVAVGLASLVIGWLVYDTLCRMTVERHPLALAVPYAAFLVLATWALCQLLPGRAAFVHVGAMIATTMSANVFFWIIPGQKLAVAQMQRGETPDPIHGKRAKQRSLHNNYLTLPVLVCMISNHYGFIYTHDHAWLALAFILLAGALVRHFFNERHKGRNAWPYPAVGVALLVGVGIWLAPARLPALAATAPVDLAQVQRIVATRCTACHAEHPSLVAAAPGGILLDTPQRIAALRERIGMQAVQLRAMPLGNVTAMTEDERTILGNWVRQGRAP